MLKNAFIYIAEPGKLNFDVSFLNEQLSKLECPSEDYCIQVTSGFVRPVIDSDFAIDIGHGFIALKYKRIERKPPASAVNAELKKRIEKIKNEENRKVFKEERANLKGQIFDEFAKRAFPVSSYNLVVIDTQQSRIFVDASNQLRAEDVLSRLRSAVESLPVVPIADAGDLDNTLTYWAKNPENTPEGIYLGDRCELRAVLNKRPVARFTNVEVESPEVSQQLGLGWKVSKVEIVFNDELVMYLSSSLSLKSIKMLDVLKLKVSESEPETALAEFLTTMFLQMSALRKLIDTLV